MNRISTGIKKLDDELGGGLPENACVIMSGDAGSGKTLFGLNFLLTGAANGEKSVYVSLNEPAKDLLRACDGIKSLSKARDLLGKNFVIEEIKMDEMIDLEYFAKIFETYPKIDRLVIDNVNKLLMFAQDKRDYRVNLAALIRTLRRRVSSTILICETLDHTLDTGNGEAYEADGAMAIGFVDVEEKPKRTFGIYKMRYTAFDERVLHDFEISEDGLKLKATKVI